MRVAVLMSGGVDSTAAALLLLQQGYEVFGITMVHMDDGVGEEAARAAADLGIQHHIIDLHSVFQETVVQYFCQEYERGRTPNPCVMCNEQIKFGILLQAALDLGADKVATGHYARVEFDVEKHCYHLKKGKDPQKDQSYFLYRLQQQQLARILFPLGNYLKEEVREFAQRHSLEASAARESQEICFIPDDYRAFIRPRVSYQAGSFIDRKGKRLGSHQGIPFYTIGQRRGLGISAGRPVYVTRIDARHNQIVLGDEEDLYTSIVRSEHNSFVYPQIDSKMVQVTAKIRYAAREKPAVLSHICDDVWELVFDEAQRAVTPGQSVVYYQGEYVLGGGIIMSENI
ncbi:MAG TPA: tRNA 2-thiouridine(34) synthase MnmA [Syntrophomonadaceae bacterium]|nr:tRNA 2-thiouridine(34) synthase MnmA [Syntrophomonadaceae bacterium]